MKLLYIWTYAVIVFFSAINGQTISSEQKGISTAPVSDNKSFTTLSPNQSSPAQLDTDNKSENYTTPNNSSTKNLEDVDDDEATTRNNSLLYTFTVAPTHNGTTEPNEAMVPGVGDTEATEEEREEGNTALTTEKNVTKNNTGSSWGYVILLLILLLILALCIILFYMRRVSRTYTFDLQRPPPSRHEPIGSFEPVYLDDLDYQVHTSGMSKPAEANGTVLSTEDKELNGEVSQTIGQQTPESSPTAETEPTQVQPDQDQVNQDQPDQDQVNQDQPDQDQVNQDQPDQDQVNQDLSSNPVLFIEESQEEINENNNNNPSVRSSAFVEINLDEPQSSVQPFNFSDSELQHFY